MRLIVADLPPDYRSARDPDLAVWLDEACRLADGSPLEQPTGRADRNDNGGAVGIVYHDAVDGLSPDDVEVAVVRCLEHATVDVPRIDWDSHDAYQLVLIDVDRPATSIAVLADWLRHVATAPAPRS